MDNASTDGSAEIALEFQPHAALIRNAQNVGFGRAVNQGLAAARAPLVLIMNPDCRLEPGAIEPPDARTEPAIRRAPSSARASSIPTAPSRAAPAAIPTC